MILLIISTFCFSNYSKFDLSENENLIQNETMKSFLTTTLLTKTCKTCRWHNVTVKVKWPEGFVYVGWPKTVPETKDKQTTLMTE